MEPVVYNRERKILEIIDQTQLPKNLIKIDCADVDCLAEAIIMLRVRGAPAIGVAAAYGLVLALNFSSDDNYKSEFDDAYQKLAATRPTAVNLFNALFRVKKAFQKCQTRTQAFEAVLNEADSIKKEDLQMCKAIGSFGAQFIKEGQTWLTHCNAGALATAGHGTALGVFRTAKEQGKNFSVYVDETRPLLQGSRLTAWELMQEKIDCTLICDGAAASLIGAGKVDGIITGADRITSKGFVANKTGTYSLALIAKYNAVPFYVAAPDTTFDLDISYAEEIEIEQRDPDEVRFVGSQQTAPVDVPVYNPAFDVTPPELITGIITNLGVAKPIYRDTIPQLFEKR